MNDVKLKLEANDKELKNALEAFRNARTPLQKSQAKQKAANLLKKKKMYESHLNNLSTTQYNVENAHMTTQMMKDNMDIMSTLKGTIDVQKDMMKNMNPDHIYDMMDDMKDIQEQQEELNEAFSRNYEIDVGDEELDAGKLISNRN
jgi:charged multivesicular body protein 5